MIVKECDSHLLAEDLPYPSSTANKYTRGKLIIVGGSKEYPGAVCLAAHAAMRMGAGYVDCHCAPATVPLVQQSMASLVARPWEISAVSEAVGTLPSEHHPCACLMGSGMHDEGFQRSLVSEVLRECSHPLVIDGGALRMVADASLIEAVRARTSRGAATILTPHGGEADALARAMGIVTPAAGASDDAQASFAVALANGCQAHVLLKGPVSFIASPSQSSQEETVVYRMGQGSSALAKAGTGDVLAGMVGALLCQRCAPGVSCALAAVLHAEAARFAVRGLGIISVCAEDVISHIPHAIEALKRG